MDNKLTKPALLVLLISFFFSLASLIIYINESDFPDEVLFSLLGTLRYSSFLVCISSVYVLINSIIEAIRKPSVLPVVLIVLSFFFAVYGAGMTILEAFIITISQGV